MPYEKESSQNFDYPIETVFQAAKYCVPFMGGKILKEDAENGLLHAQMDKKLFGDYLGDRSRLELTFSSSEDNKTDLTIFGYPLNAVGQKLMFGAREGVVETMITAFFEQLEKRLQTV